MIGDMFGEIGSPVIPGTYLYPSNYDCVWFLPGPPVTTTIITIVEMEMFTCDDYLEIAEVDRVADSTSEIITTEKLCDSDKGIGVPKEFKRPVVLKFHSDHSLISRGFHLFYVTTNSGKATRVSTYC